MPSQSYYAFATKVGCAPSTAYGSSAQTIFSCLVGKDTYTLQNASQSISSSGTYGSKDLYWDVNVGKLLISV